MKVSVQMCYGCGANPEQAGMWDPEMLNSEDDYYEYDDYYQVFIDPEGNTCPTRLHHNITDWDTCQEKCYSTENCDEIYMKNGKCYHNLYVSMHILGYLQGCSDKPSQPSHRLAWILK